MIIRLSIFGIEVFCLSFLESYAVQETEEESDDGEETTLIGGGSAHNFERDTTPLDPADHFGEWEFGFGKPKRKKGGDHAQD